MRRNANLLPIIIALVMILTPACALGNLLASNDVQPVPTPSRTPKPTFTPTPPELATPQVAPTFTATPEPPPTNTPAEPTPTDTPEATPTPEEPTATPTPDVIRLVIDNPTLNVRSGPSTAYSRIGQVSNGERFDVTGRNEASSWWQIDFNGRDGWVSGQYVRLEGDQGAVQIAQSIPAPPPTATRVPPTATPPPAPTAVPRPQFAYSYQTGSMISNPNCGTVYLEGKVVDAAGNGINGITVELEFFGNRVYRITGEGKSPGEWGFTPLSPEFYKTAVPFNLRLVESRANTSSISDTWPIAFNNCDSAGQFTNIIFRRN